MKKIYVKRDEIMKTVNIAICHAVFEEDTMLFVDQSEGRVETSCDELLFDPMEGYVIKHDQYAGKPIPEGDVDERDSNGLNEFQRWLTDQLFIHANGMHEHFLNRGIELVDLD